MKGSDLPGDGEKQEEKKEDVYILFATLFCIWLCFFTLAF
jgi:hypothetical protein